jgi:hypothetical protein
LPGPKKLKRKGLKFAHICSKHALKYTIFINIKKGQKMAKWPSHFISGKQFQKRPNGNPDRISLFTVCYQILVVPLYRKNTRKTSVIRLLLLFLFWSIVILLGGGQYRSGVGNSFGFAGHIRDKLGIRGPGHVHVN